MSPFLSMFRIQVSTASRYSAHTARLISPIRWLDAAFLDDI